jgi:hypothetical protein
MERTVCGIGEVEVNRQLLKRKRSVETHIKEESVKRRKLECEMNTLKTTTKKQAKVIARLKSGSQGKQPRFFFQNLVSI